MNPYLMAIMVAVVVLLILEVVHSMAVKAGWEGNVRVAANVGALSGASNINWTDLPFEAQNGIKKIFSGGYRNTVDLKETLIDIITSITRDYEDWATLAARAGVGDTGAMTEYGWGIYPEGYGAGNRKIEMTVKFNTWKIEMKSGEVTKESSEIMVKGAPTVGTL